VITVETNSLFAMITFTWLSLIMTLSAIMTLKLNGRLVTEVGHRLCGVVVKGSSKPGGSLLQVSSRRGPLGSQSARSGPYRCWGISSRLQQLRSGASIRDTELIAKSGYMPRVPGICIYLFKMKIVHVQSKIIKRKKNTKNKNNARWTYNS